MYTLYGGKGCGSAVIEVVLDWVRAPYRFVPASAWDTPGADREALLAANPLGQVPTLVTPAGRTLTESAAILFWLLEQYPDNELMPAQSTVRADVYRWMCFLAATVYAAIGVGDFPARWLGNAAAHDDLKETSLGKVKDHWRQFDAALTPAPFLLGPKLCVLDLYAAMMARWRPGPDWFRQELPDLAASFALTEQHPVVARVWERNFA